MTRQACQVSSLPPRHVRPLQQHLPLLPHVQAVLRWLSEVSQREGLLPRLPVEARRRVWRDVPVPVWVSPVELGALPLPGEWVDV